LRVNGISVLISTLNQDAPNSLITAVTEDIVTLAGGEDVSLCAITSIQFVTAGAVAGVCDPDAEPCNCDAAIRALFEAVPAPTQVFIRDNNSAGIGIATVIETCNDVVWFRGSPAANNRYYVIPYNSVFYLI
jgi:hypothetical protein